jgi:hypothetical protein
MTRIWKLLVLPAAAAIVFAGTVFAQGDGQAPATDKAKQADKRLETISNDMAAAKADLLLARNRLQSAQERFEQLEKEIADAKNDLLQLRGDRGPGTVTTQPLYPPEQANLEAIARRLAKIEQDLARLTNPPRVSQYPAPATGRLKLVNDSVEEMQFVINGRAFRVAPGAAHVVEGMPAGAFTYEVVSPTWGLRANRSTTLAAGETFTLVAHY